MPDPTWEAVQRLARKLAEITRNTGTVPESELPRWRVVNAEDEDPADWWKRT